MAHLSSSVGRSRLASSSRGFTSVPKIVVSRRTLPVVHVLDCTPANYEQEVTKADSVVLLDFWASWCGPCKLVAPMMVWAEKTYGSKLKVVKVEHDINPELIAKYKVYGLPTLILVKDGEMVQGSHREGAVTKAMLEKYLADNGIVA